ncbi:HK97 family phage prohead protease [Domibacillus aminovorans]|uniref:Peptidase U35 n=1 Tax=Domibacillus aminovorans TaxID=29332 RepID=A0A177L5Y0_9BACI|nr:HK97 family phage prohead protease [Domibacillus aminovorans]OAH60747.1 peptidase U35 [Domibacillus aminovorans]
MTKKLMETVTELRDMPSLSVEIREEAGGSATVAGYAVKWEMKSHPLGWDSFREQFRRGAFTESLGKDNQFALWSHDTRTILGSKDNGTLRLYEDDIGLRFELDLPDTPNGQNAYGAIKRGDVKGVSFGFRAKKQEWDERDPDNIIRTITQADLFEISPVAFPAYPDSGVAARSNDPFQQYLNERKQAQEAELRQRLIAFTYL